MKVKLDEGAYLPTKAHKADAGLDLRAREQKVILPHSSEVFDTGVHIAIPEGYVGILASKSGLNNNFSLTTEGVIDSGYTGSIRVKVYNFGNHPYMFEKGDKITQLMIIKLHDDDSLEEVDELEDTPRGNNGFGSSGR